MGYEPGRLCEVCGCGSPYVPVCGECEIDRRAAVRIDALEEANEKLRADLARVTEECDALRARHVAVPGEVREKIDYVLRKADDDSLHARRAPRALRESIAAYAREGLHWLRSLPAETVDPDGSILDLGTPEAEVDAQCRAMGLDPVALRERGAAFVAKLQAETVEQRQDREIVKAVRESGITAAEAHNGALNCQRADDRHRYSRAVDCMTRLSNALRGEP